MRAARRPAGAAAGAADPIAWHPAVRRTLLTLQARTDAARTLALWTAMKLDESAHHPDAATREQAQAVLAFLTPVAKALFTDLGHRSADEALQVWGGYGFVHDYGIEQTVRDSRIAMIYEGTNEIQAIDLVTRKLLPDGGRVAASLRETVRADGQRLLDAPAATGLATALREQLDAWAAADAALLGAAARDPEAPLRVADDYLAGVGHALMAWSWARIARVALNDRAPPVPGSRAAEAWLDSARFGIEWLLPQASVHWTRVHRCERELPFVAAS